MTFLRVADFTIFSGGGATAIVACWRAFRPFLRALLSTSLLIAATLFAAPASAEGAGRLFFIDPTTGRIVVGGVDRNGQFHKNIDVVVPSQKGRGVVVPVASGVLLYDYFDGGGQLYRLDGDEDFGPGANVSFSKQWNYAIGLGEYVFFYDLNGATNIGALVSAAPDGSMAQTYTTTSFSPWTLVAPTDNELFFYNKTSGLAATATILVNGTLSQNGAAFTIGTGYTNLAALEDNVLLFNFSNGAWESGVIDYTTTSGTSPTYVRAVIATTNTLGLKGMDEAVAINGRLLVYNSATGAAILGHFQPVNGNTAAAGQFIKDKILTFPKFFTNLMRAGNFLAFYSLGTGELEIGYFDLGGNYHQTQDFKFGIGLSAAASVQ